MNNSYFTFLPMIIMFALFYFMLIRPQRKAAEAKRKMIESMQAGDGVVTIGGLHGIIDEVNQQDGLVVIDCEGVYLTFELSAIANVLKSAGHNEELEEAYDHSQDSEFSSEEENSVDGELETDTNL
ncbi:preprotein translocase subunit YajC [Facklamia miroungae]|uniref:Preprotein translocase subunit YajC n=1 Tax=Facklamia miroungae TaxID=120956 RepID=A0A1G7R2S1_9LACT|nr:preprotein translocase subunit YajC [Facklamia miroungae]NKZ29163.1 preprotein translocase subunit YajC [Facklamia miroungae]SDG05076.1 preprotein translocase subunit YajC [Facklamia miroungae]